MQNYFKRILARVINASEVLFGWRIWRQRLWHRY